MPTHALRISVIDILKRTEFNSVLFAMFHVAMHFYIDTVYQCMNETFYLILYVVSCNTTPPLILTGRSFPYTSNPILKSASVLFVFKNCR